MTDETARILFAAIYLPFALARLHYHRLAGKEQRPWFSPWEGRVFAALRVLVGLPMMAILVLYLVWPSPLSFASLLIPGALRWVGATLFAIGAGLVIWVNRTLGRNFSGSLVLRPDHQLVRGGPYRWVRHPMYTAFVVTIVGMLLLSANLLVGGIPLVLLPVVLLVRTPREEAMLLDRFGDEYRHYMTTTGRFLPRLGG